MRAQRGTTTFALVDPGGSPVSESRNFGIQFNNFCITLLYPNHNFCIHGDPGPQCSLLLTFGGQQLLLFRFCPNQLPYVMLSHTSS